jgi:hypothetical protein
VGQPPRQHPISSFSHAPSGALSVIGHGLTLSFPADWVNVPTTPAAADGESQPPNPLPKRDHPREARHRKEVNRG